MNPIAKAMFGQIKKAAEKSLQVAHNKPDLKIESAIVKINCIDKIDVTEIDAVTQYGVFPVAL